jgi:hypothetical protein
MSDAVRHLIVAAGLSVQHTCVSCGALLKAFGRPIEEMPPSRQEFARNEKWSCLECSVPDATRANRADPKAAS